jgi:protein ImuA
MSAVPDLAALLQRPDVWRGDEITATNYACVPSGCPELDAALPGGGWPTGSLTEFLVGQPGVGEVAMLRPALAQLSDAGGWIALVAPPLPPYAPALQQSGIALDRLLVLDVGPKEALWCFEQILGSGAFAAALAWLPAAKPPQIRRLQVAQQGQRGLAFTFRPKSCASQSSAAPLRIELLETTSPNDDVALRLLKRRGAPLEQTIYLPVTRPVFPIDVDTSVVSPPLSTPTARSVSTT